MERKGKFICKNTYYITTNFDTMHEHLPFKSLTYVKNRGKW